jgi:L-histidine N-alpha-methyltransferase
MTQLRKTSVEHTSDRIRIIDLAPAPNDFAADVRAGLTSRPKTLVPRYFYDDLGVSLFEAICRLPEYYVARAEDEILDTYGEEILETVGRPLRLVELGSGEATKTRRLIRRLVARQHRLDYLAVDMEATTLRAMAEALVSEFATLSVVGLAATFESGIARLTGIPPAAGEATLVLFFGTTIGNFDPPSQRELLRSLRGVLRPGDALLLGADEVKSASILVPAYDDALGVTGAFNRNVLVRINRELRSTFDLALFRHTARYDEELNRIEMHLVSTVAQRVSIAALGMSVVFQEGESIHTENSYKFTEAAIRSLAAESGFALVRSWTDGQSLYSDHLLVAE